MSNLDLLVILFQHLRHRAHVGLEQLQVAAAAAALFRHFGAQPRWCVPVRQPARSPASPRRSSSLSQQGSYTAPPVTPTLLAWSDVTQTTFSAVHPLCS